VLECKQLTVMEEHHTRCKNSTPFVLNGPTQF
jgi:hypothetical protein